MAFTDRRRIEWGDCDEAGIVFYPNYFRWMDGTFHALCTEAGFQQRRLRTEHEIFGTPLVSADATFVAPATYGEWMNVDLTIARMGGTSLQLEYRFVRDGLLIAKGSETRVFVRRADDGSIAKTDIPVSVKLALSRIAE